MELQETNVVERSGDSRTEAAPAQSPASVPELIQTVYPELRRIARVLMLGERKEHTLVPTALVHEAVLRLLGLKQLHVEDARHFFLLAVNQMRRILTSYARKRLAQKRFALRDEDPGEFKAHDTIDAEQVVVLDHVLDRLAAIDARAHRVVVLRFFAGLEFAEIGKVLGLSEITIRRDWEFARTWLFGELGEF